MTEPKRFKRGSRTYTRLGAYKEVRIEHLKDKEKPVDSPAQQIQMDIDPGTEVGIYSNTAVVHRSSDEVTIDFAFVPSQSPRGRVRSRVILSPKQARQVARLLKQAADEADFQK